MTSWTKINRIVMLYTSRHILLLTYLSSSHSFFIKRKKSIAHEFKTHLVYCVCKLSSRRRRIANENTYDSGLLITENLLMEVAK